MNIEDRSSLRSESWTNTSSFNIESIAGVTYPWWMNRIHLPDQYTYTQNNTRLHNRILSDDIIKADSPVSRTATWSSSDQKVNYNWPLWMFGAVAGALNFGSIILPLIAGHVYRSIARFSLRKRGILRAIISLLWTS